MDRIDILITAGFSPMGRITVATNIYVPSHTSWWIDMHGMLIAPPPYPKSDFAVRKRPLG